MHDSNPLPSVPASESVQSIETIFESRSGNSDGYLANPVLSAQELAIPRQRTQQMLDLLHNPERDLALVHVAGSVGKSSTCVYIASTASSAGYRTGLYISPHLHSVTERISVNGVPIDQSQLGAWITKIDSLANDLEQQKSIPGRASTFELLTAAALGYFSEQQCDLAVIEVGLGGIWDPTNVIDPTVSVLTTIELEHTAILGSSETEIARNKAGIIKPGRVVVSSRQSHPVAEVFRTTAAEVDASLYLGGEDWTWYGSHDDFRYVDDHRVIDNLTLPSGGDAQCENAATATCASFQLGNIGIHFNHNDVRTGLAEATIPGRFEIIDTPGTRFILDGAHTVGAIRHLVTACRNLGLESAPVVFAARSDKDIHGLLSELASFADPLILTHGPRGRSSDPDDAAILARELGFDPVVTTDVRSAMTSAESAQRRHIATIVTGSLATVAEARALIQPDDAGTV